MPRKVLTRYMYSCEGFETYRGHRDPSNRHCGRFEVIDGIHENDADAVARKHGWRMEHGQWFCKEHMSITSWGARSKKESADK